MLRQVLAVTSDADEQYLEQARHTDGQQRRKAGIALTDNADNPVAAAAARELPADLVLARITSSAW
jgi:hypothetical protein